MVLTTLHEARNGSLADNGKMTDENQIQIPPSFVALFVPPGRIKPTESRAHIAERYDFCEDLANLMTEHAKATQFDLGITEQDVLERCLAGLKTTSSGVSTDEAAWVVRRLAELLEWPDEFLKANAHVN